MLEKLLLVNFQRHEKLRIDFDPKVTVIVGPSDAGKSAVIRALRWLVTNRPLGNAFIRHGTEEAEARLGIDGHTISRKRGKENLYLLDGNEFKAFKDEPPQQVSDLLRIGDVNFQQQHDAPYWFSLTAGEVGRQLNAVVDLTIIDESLGMLASNTRAVKADRDAADRALLVCQKKFDEVRDVPVMVDEFVVVEKLEESAAAVTRKSATCCAQTQSASIQAGAVETLQMAAICGRRAIETCVAAGKAGKRLTQCRDLVVEIGQLIKKAKKPPSFDHVVKLSDEWIKKDDRVLYLNDCIRDIKSLSAKIRKPPDFNKVSHLHHDMTERLVQIGGLDYVLDKAKVCLRDYKLAMGRAGSAHAKFEKVAGDACPLCGK